MKESCVYDVDGSNVGSNERNRKLHSYFLFAQLWFPVVSG